MLYARSYQSSGCRSIFEKFSASSPMAASSSPSAALRVWQMLSIRSGEQDYAARTRKLFDAYAADVHRSPAAYAYLLAAIDDMIESNSRSGSELEVLRVMQLRLDGIPAQQAGERSDRTQSPGQVVGEYRARSGRSRHLRCTAACRASRHRAYRRRRRRWGWRRWRLALPLRSST